MALLLPEFPTSHLPAAAELVLVLHHLVVVGARGYVGAAAAAFAVATITIVIRGRRRRRTLSVLLPLRPLPVKVYQRPGAFLLRTSPPSFPLLSRRDVVPPFHCIVQPRLLL